ncbi:MAG: VWA domain-containing protein [Bryobacteraceae bacterium]
MVSGWLLAALLFSAQEPQQPVFRAETALALVRFHVVRDNRYVTGLKPEDIVLLEDGVPRKLTLFEGGRAGPRSLPVEIAVVFDISGSVTRWGLLDPLVFKTALLDGMPNVRLSVYGFGGRLHRFSRPTRDPEALAAAFRRVLDFRSGARPRPDLIPIELPPKRKANMPGGTWLYESVIGAARDAASMPGSATRMLLVFSDGFPTTNTHPEDAAGVARELGLPVYPVVLGHAHFVEQAGAVQQGGYRRDGSLKEGARRRLERLQDKEDDMRDFASLGELTGGRSFDPPLINLNMLRQILGGVAAQVACEYVVGFSPPPPDGPPKRHKLQVRVARKELGKVLGGTRTIEH